MNSLLKDIWIDVDITENMLNYLSPMFPEMDTDKLRAYCVNINNLIKTECHLYLPLELRYSDDAIAKEQLQYMINQRLVNLFFSFRSQVEVFNYADLGKSRRINKNQLYDNDVDEANTIYKESNYVFNQLDNIFKASEITKEINYYLKGVANEIKQLVIWCV